jgi:hypothetical protein
MEEQPFESAWRNAFRGKEKQPPPHIWNALSARLARADAGRQRKRLLFFQWLAAAGVVFGLGIGWWSVQQTTRNGATTSAMTDATPPEARGVRPRPPDKPAAGAAQDKVPQDNSASSLLADTNEHTRQVSPRPANSSVFTPSRSDRFNRKATLFLVQAKQLGVQAGLPTVSDSVRIIGTATDATAVVSAIRQPEKNVSMPHVAQTDAAAAAASEKKKKDVSPWWAAVGFAGGGFGTAGGSGQEADVMVSQAAEYLALASGQHEGSVAGGQRGASVASGQPEGAGTAFSFGMTVGKRVAPRWIVQSGVIYLQQVVNYRSNFVEQTAHGAAQVVLPQSFAGGLPSNLQFTPNAYAVRTHLSFLSVPALAGFVVLDRRFSILLNGGVSTDFLVQGMWQDRSGQFADNRSADVQAVYRPVNWSGLFSAEFSYRLGQRYRVVFVPGLRYTLLPLYQDHLDISFKPFIWDAGLRLQYRFD